MVFPSRLGLEGTQGVFGVVTLRKLVRMNVPFCLDRDSLGDA